MRSVTPTAVQPLVVLVHGAWHGAWCWAALQARLDALGIASLAVDLPGHGASVASLTDLHGDGQHVADVIDHWAGGSDTVRRVVLVGHSYGGAVITEAAVRTAHVGHLVYLAAFTPSAGESLMGVLGSMPPQQVALGAAMTMRDDGTSVLDPVLAIPALYGSCAPAVAAAAIQRLSPHPMSTFHQATTGDPRATIESTYVICTLDQAVHVEHQWAMAERCTTTITLDTDHSPFVSRPDETAHIIEVVVRRVANAAR